MRMKHKSIEEELSNLEITNKKIWLEIIINNKIKIIISIDLRIVIIYYKVIIGEKIV
jgi:hypothetical protein